LGRVTSQGKHTQDGEHTLSIDALAMNRTVGLRVYTSAATAAL